MTLTVLKSSFKKKPPKIVSYRDYKSYSNENFINELNNFINMVDECDLASFEEVFMKIFNKQAPIKFKYIRAN